MKKKRYAGAFSPVTGTTVGTDALGRVLPVDCGGQAAGREVGIFYFLWLGQHGRARVLDNSLLSKIPGALGSEQGWMAAGGGNVGESHFWGKPMFGYYTSDDEWVMRKHVMMLTDAGVDYLVFDTTNAAIYRDQALMMLRLLHSVRAQGFPAPRAAFYTNTRSGETIDRIYDEIYSAHPEYEDSWYRRDGRPMIVGDPDDPALRPEVKEFFRIKRAVWPNGPRYDDGFPWMEFDRLETPDAVYGLNGQKEDASVSVAQHNVTVRMSYAAWYGAEDRCRSWNGKENDRSAEAVARGDNFALQWKWAAAQDVKSVFVTGFNEWTAMRQPGFPINFVDCADPYASRDVEPMAGGFGDNYYMQLIACIRAFKGTGPRTDIGGWVRGDPMSDPSLFGSAAVYCDYAGDSADRDAEGFGGIRYINRTGLNDFTRLSVLRDRKTLYFRAETAENVRQIDGDGRMTLLLDTDSVGIPKYAVNRGALSEGKMTVEKKCGNGWERIGSAEFRIDGNALTIALPRGLIGLDTEEEEENDLLSLAFKWTDGCDPENAVSLYTDGDAAPLGRLYYLYSNIQ